MGSGVSVDEFQALEQRVLRAVEIVKREREARANAEAEVASLREQLAAQERTAESRLAAMQEELAEIQNQHATAEGQINVMNHERDVVRQRVEKLLQQMDELI
jgi:chromosome segregation ATPase